MLLESDTENLVRYVNRSLDEEEDFHFLRFEFLQRLNLAQLQVKLVRMKSQFQKTGKTSPAELETLQTTLAAYGELQFYTPYSHQTCRALTYTNPSNCYPRLPRSQVNQKHRQHRSQQKETPAPALLPVRQRLQRPIPLPLRPLQA